MQIRDWLVYHVGDRALKKALDRVFAQGRRGLLLDIGCGLKPYANLTRGRVARHIGVDHPASLHGNTAVDVGSNAYQLPFRDDTFDVVLCSSVLEHLEEPEAALREAARVLGPGGQAVYVTPFMWHIHEEPRDFYRYSRYGLHHLFGKGGFEHIEVIPLSGFWVTFGQLFVHQLYRLQRGPMRWVPVIPVAGLAIQVFALVLDKLDRAPGSRKWTWAYLTVARKAAPSASA
jgi:ubiquinone/menaquinone biosynthesis C-methylase UbiE